MENFDFYVDQKVTTWYRTHFQVEAENKEEAKQKAIEFYEQGNTEDISWEDTADFQELMSVEDNGGSPVTEIYNDMGELVFNDGKN